MLSRISVACQLLHVTLRRVASHPNPADHPVDLSACEKEINLRGETRFKVMGWQMEKHDRREEASRRTQRVSKEASLS